MNEFEQAIERGRAKKEEERREHAAALQKAREDREARIEALLPDAHEWMNEEFYPGVEIAVAEGKDQIEFCAWAEQEEGERLIARYRALSAAGIPVVHRTSQEAHPNDEAQRKHEMYTLIIDISGRSRR